jgi:hypothetical protein
VIHRQSPSKEFKTAAKPQVRVQGRIVNAKQVMCHQYSPGFSSVCRDMHKNTADLAANG